MGLGGTWNNSPLSKADVLNAERAVFTAFESGITRFDHADIYCLGKSEEVFGKILKMHPDFRTEIQVQSKAGIEYHKGINASNTYNFSKTYILQSTDEILKRLQIEYLDMFLFHRPDPLIYPEELADTIDFLINSGKVKSIGVSNMSPSMLHFINQCSRYSIMANQIQFSLNHSGLLNEIVEFNAESIQESGLFAQSHLEQFEIQAWSPLNKGIYSEAQHNNDLPEYYNEPVKLMSELAEKYKTNISAIQLAWILKLPFNITPIIGTTKPDRIKDCTESLTINLDRDDWYNLWILARNQKLK